MTEPNKMSVNDPRNGFRLFKKYKQGEIYFKIIRDDNASLERIYIILRYYVEDDFPEKKIEIVRNRDEWMEQNGYSEVRLVHHDFDETIKEFNAGVSCENFQNVLTKFLVTEANKQIEKVW